MKLTQAKTRVLAVGVGAAMLVFFGHSTTKVSAAMAPKAPAPMHVRADNESLDFDLVNGTGYEIKHVLISRSSASEWNDDDDVLTGRPFPDGSTLHITFSPKTQAEHWDLKVVYSIDNTSHEWDGLKLTAINKITLHWDADKQVTSAETE